MIQQSMALENTMYISGLAQAQFKDNYLLGILSAIKVDNESDMVKRPFLV